MTAVVGVGMTAVVRMTPGKEISHSPFQTWIILNNEAVIRGARVI
jgi:hypothetical protein